MPHLEKIYGHKYADWQIDVALPKQIFKTGSLACHLADNIVALRYSKARPTTSVA